ncbi:MAG: hypothetical protein HOY71_01985 [Nonomuraea sp.]|nr:hypothetical protein [Nonomuraea sp.]
MRSEEDLVRTLAAASGQVERPAGDLKDLVRARRQARRSARRGRMLLAAAAVVAVTGGTTVLLSDRPEPAAPAQGLFTMPAKNAQGLPLTPITALSPTEVLLAAIPGYGRPGRLEAYDSTTRTLRALGDLPAPTGVTGYAVQNVEVGERYIAWYGLTPATRDRWADFWIMPRNGGAARQVAVVKGDAARVDELRLVADSLVWSVEQGGVYRMPLTGGAPERLPGTDGLRLTSWPWATGFPGNPSGTNPVNVVNLETRETIAVKPPDRARGVECDRDRCAGTLDGRVFVQRADGSGRMFAPPTTWRSGPAWFLGDGRLLLQVNDPDKDKADVPLGIVLDPATGRAVGVGERPAGGQGDGVASSLISSSPSTVAFWHAGVAYRQKCEGKVCTKEATGDESAWTVLNVLALPK